MSIHKLILQCVKEYPEQRPEFKDIRRIFQQELKQCAPGLACRIDAINKNSAELSNAMAEVVKPTVNLMGIEMQSMNSI